jgi:hypothetical protein
VARQKGWNKAVRAAGFTGIGVLLAAALVAGPLAGTAVAQGVTPSTTSLVSSKNPSLAGDQVTFTATVSGGSGTPTGTVDFTSDGVSVGCDTVALTPVDASNAQATCPVTYTSTAGSPHNVAANYSGDPTYAQSSASVIQTVNPAFSTTMLHASSPSATIGLPVTYTAAVTGVAGVPLTGTVSMTDDGAALCSNVVDGSGHAACQTTYNSTAGSPHQIVATYGSDPNYNQSSDHLSEPVPAVGSATTITAVPPSTTVGQLVTYTANVQGGSGTPTGSVTFTDGGSVTSCGTVALVAVDASNASAACQQTYGATAGSPHHIVASYGGDATYSPSSHGLDEPVGRGTSATALATSGTPSSAGAQVVYTATVTGAGDTPTGTVEFDDHGSVISGCAARPLGSSGPGVTSCAPTYTVPASHLITATYSGDPNYIGSTSNQVTQDVIPGPPSVVTMDSGNNQSAGVLNGYAAVLSVTVRDGSGNLLPGTGVTFTAPASGASGIFPGFASSTTVTTDANGRASTPMWANAVPGSFSVTATAGSALALFTETNLATPPSLPSFVSASVSGNLVTIVWGAPIFDGGSPVTSYTITLLPSGTNIPVNSATARSFELVFEANGFNLSVAVRANNAAGAGPDSTPTSVFIIRPGYWMVSSDGGIFRLGSAGFYGSTGGMHLNQPVVGMAVTITGGGYYLVASDGGIFTFGDARFFGSTGAIHLNRPIVGMAVTPTGRGYWLVASDGGIFAFGDARFFGSTGAIHLNRPIVGMAVTPTGRGYWLVASDGGIFAFGDAGFFGSTGAIRLNKPIVGMAATPGGTGYWLVASDGGIFAFGDARFYGSTGAIHLNQPIVGMAPSPTGRGYWLVASDGGIFSFGDATFYGSEGGTPLNRPIIGISTQPISHF